MESLDRETSSGSNTTTSFQVADPNTPNPEREFDRKWALTLLARALLTLELEHEAAGKHDQFQTLKPWLTGDTEAISQAQTAASLGVNEGALKVAIHRLRRRFRQVIKEEISQTVEDPAQVENELHCLFRGVDVNENWGEVESAKGAFRAEKKWCALQGLNLRPLPCEGNALPLS